MSTAPRPSSSSSGGGNPMPSRVAVPLRPLPKLGPRGVAQMKDRVEVARLWVHMARSIDHADSSNTANRTQKYECYTKAIEGLEEGANSSSSFTSSSSSTSASSSTGRLSTLTAHVDILMEFAEFLHSARFPPSDAVATLHEAVDLLMSHSDEPRRVLLAEVHLRAEWPGDAIEEVLQRVLEPTRFAAARDTLNGTNMNGEQVHSGGGGGGKEGSVAPSRAGGGGGGGGARTIRGGGGADDAASFVSGRTNRTRAGTITTPASEQEDLSELGIRQLLLLVQLYSMLSCMESTTVRHQIEYALVAHYYVRRVWERIMQAVEEGFYGRVPPPRPPSDASSAPGTSGSRLMSPPTASSRVGAPSSRAAATLQVPSESARRPSLSGRMAALKVAEQQEQDASSMGSPMASSTPYVGLPQSDAEWLNFRLPKNVRTWFQEQQQQFSDLTSPSVAKKAGEQKEEKEPEKNPSVDQRWSTHLLHPSTCPPSTVVPLLHYLSHGTLPALQAGGFLVHTLPIYYLMELLIATVQDPASIMSSIQVRGFTACLALQVSRVMDQFHQPHLMQTWMARAEPWGPAPDSDEEVVLRTWIEEQEEVARKEQQQQQQQQQLTPSRPGTALSSTPSSASFPASSPRLGDDIVQSSPSSLDSSPTATPLPTLGSSTLTLRSIWNQLVSLLIDRGRLPQAKLLIHHWVYRAAMAASIKDPLNVARLHRNMSRIAMMEGAGAHALSLEQQAQHLYSGRALEWAEGVEHALLIMSRMMVLKGSSTPLPSKIALVAQQKSMILQALHTFQTALKERCGGGSTKKGGSPARVATTGEADAPDLKAAIARMHLAHARWIHEQITWQYAGFGGRGSHNPSHLPIAFHEAQDLNAAAADEDMEDPTGGMARTASTASLGAASVASFSSQLDGAGGKDGTPQRAALSPEHQALYTTMWECYTQAEFIYDAMQSQEPSAKPIPSYLQPLDDPVSLLTVLTEHAHSLVRYAEQHYAPPAASLMMEAASSTDHALMKALLTKVTLGAQALHQALSLLVRAEQLCAEQLLLVKSATTPSSTVSLPLSRTLHSIHTLMSQLYLNLHRYKRPFRLYTDLDAQTKKVHQNQAQVLQVAMVEEDAAAYGGHESEHVPTQLSFVLEQAELEDAQSVSGDHGMLVGGASTSRSAAHALSPSAQRALEAKQSAMNEYFFSKYSSIFTDESDQAVSLANAGEEGEFNELALQLAASATNLSGGFINVIKQMAAAQGGTTATPSSSSAGADGAATALQPASPSTSLPPSIPAFHARLLLDNPAPFLQLGRALSALALEAREAFESHKVKEQLLARQQADQDAWTAQLEKEAARRQLELAAQEDPRARELLQLEEERDRQAAAEALVREQEREAAARQMLLQQDAERRRQEAEAAAAALTEAGTKPGSAGGSKKKKKASNGSLQPHSSSSRPSSASKSMSRPGTAGSFVHFGGAAPPPTRPVFEKKWEHDSSGWSPAHLQRHIEVEAKRAEVEQKKMEEEAAGGANGGNGVASSKKKPAGSPSASSSKKSVAPSPRSKKSSKSDAVDVPDLGLPADSVPSTPSELQLPSFPTPTSLEGQSISALQPCINVCIRSSVDMLPSTLATLSSASLELVNVFGTLHPLHASKYLHLHMAASIKQQALDMLMYASASTSAEALVLQRAATLGTQHEVPGPELERMRVFLREYSESWVRLSYYAQGFLDQNAYAPLETSEGASGVTTEREKASGSNEDAAASASNSTTGADSTPDPALHGHASFLSLLHSLPSSLVPFALHYDAPSQCLYGVVHPSRDSPSSTTTPLVARVALDAAQVAELSSLLTLSAGLTTKIQRSVLVYGSRSSSVTLDRLERSYASFLSRLDGFFNETLMDRLMLSLTNADFMFADKEVVLLVAEPSLWSLPLESLSVLSSARSVSRDFSLHFFAARLDALLTTCHPLIQAGVNIHSVAYMVDDQAQDGSVISDPLVVGAPAARVVLEARKEAEEMVEKAAAAATNATASGGAAGAASPLTSTGRPQSGSKKSSTAPGKKGAPPPSTASNILLLTPQDQLLNEVDPLSLNDMTRIMGELKSMVELPGCCAGNATSVMAMQQSAGGNAVVGGGAAAGAANAAAGKSDKESSAALSALKAASLGWMGLSGSQHIPVAAEWARLLSGGACTQQGMFVYLGYEAFLSRFAPHHFLNLPALGGVTRGKGTGASSNASSAGSGVQLMLLMDRSVNESSYRAQSKLDLCKSARDRSLESPFATALFASMRGVNTVVQRVHASSGAANTALTKRLVESMMWEGMSVGAAVRNQQRAQLAHVQLGLRLVQPERFGVSRPGTRDGIFPGGLVASNSTTSLTGSPSFSSPQDPVDMMRYLDHAVWAAGINVLGAPASSSNAVGQANKKAGGANNAARGSSRAVRPLIPTSVRLRESSPVKGATGGLTDSRSPTRTGNRKVAGRSTTASPTPLLSGTATPLTAPQPTPEPTLKLRVYDQWNIMCVGLPQLKLVQ